MIVLDTNFVFFFFASSFPSTMASGSPLVAPGFAAVSSWGAVASGSSCGGSISSPDSHSTSSSTIYTYEDQCVECIDHLDG